MSLNDNVFNDLISKIRAKEYAPVEKFINSNKDTLSKDPEYYVLLLNYVIQKGKLEGIVVAKGEAKQDEIELRDPNTGEAVGFIGSRVSYDEDLIISGIKQTQRALKNFNDRLDIHFGIIMVAETINRLDIVGNQLVSILEVSKDIDNKWIWGPINSMDGDPKDFMIQNVLSRTSKMFYAETAVADESYMKVSKAIIEHYPDMIYGYANLGTIYMAKKQLNLAKINYDKALEIDPGDDIVIANMKKLKELMKEQE
jgi:tetratricopeptide (TPR) repeat protein